MNFRLEREKLSWKIQEVKDCTFAPDVNRKPVEFYNYDVKSDKYTRNFIDRLDKAKKVKEETHMKKNPNYGNVKLIFISDTK